MIGHAFDQDLAREAREATCPACGYHVAVPLYAGGRQPLATLAWPATAEAARSMPRLPLDFVRCVDCGHVFNTAFSYAEVPYSEKPNLMFNRGALWSDFLSEVRTEMLRRLPDHPVVVEIGHGDGSFLSSLAEARPEGRYIGFDPHGAVLADGPLELRPELFEPANHLEELRPDLVVSRHVLEHLSNPLGFLQRISFAAACLNTPLRAYFEVPCIDRALEHGRTVDLYYEHSSQFTTESFTRLLDRCAGSIESLGQGYQGEVVYGFVRLGRQRHQIATARDARQFRDRAEESRDRIRRQLDDLASSGLRVAVWGGTGKSAAFMQQYGVDAHRFPVVVDSDPQKAGTYAPGTGQLIRFRDWLVDHPADVVVIPPQWRAHDILLEMERCGIRPRSVLIEHDGRLVDYHRADHPYRRPEPGPVDGSGSTPQADRALAVAGRA